MEDKTNKETTKHRAGFVNIIGNPNVGKSTLMNALVGEKLSIVTAKAQTTRHRIMGIVNGDDYQIVYSDTPGILKPNYRLGGNVERGKVSGEPNARLEGRSVVGHLARPAYNIQKEGTVVVRIAVDQNGKVIEAIPGFDGTTVTDKSLWNAARNAAMSAKFSNTTDVTKIKQYGTITYIFKLTK